MSQQATHIQKLVERKQLLEDELLKVDRELDLAVDVAGHASMERKQQHHEQFENKIKITGIGGK